MVIMYWWARQYPVTDCKDEAEVDKKTAIDVYQWLREVKYGSSEWLTLHMSLH